MSSLWGAKSLTVLTMIVKPKHTLTCRHMRASLSLSWESSDLCRSISPSRCRSSSLSSRPEEGPFGSRWNHDHKGQKMTMVKKNNQLESLQVVAEANDNHTDTPWYPYIYFLLTFWTLTHTQKQLEPTCIKPSLTSFPPSTPCWRLLIWSLKEITWKGGDKMGKQTIYKWMFFLHTEHPWDIENHSDWILPLEKKLQVDLLTWTPSRGPHGASLEPVEKTWYKWTDHYAVYKLQLVL